MTYINIDEAVDLTIACKVGRSFELSVNTNRDLIGKTHKMQVMGGYDVDVVLTLTTGNGITVQGQSLVLTRSPDQMAIAPGVYNFDLVELSGDRAENLFVGKFIVQPSYTTLL